MPAAYTLYQQKNQGAAKLANRVCASLVHTEKKKIKRALAPSRPSKSTSNRELRRISASFEVENRAALNFLTLLTPLMAFVMCGSDVQKILSSISALKIGPILADP